MNEALLLVAHGSPDPDWRAPLERIHTRLRTLAPQRRVELAYMEFLEPSIAHAAAKLVDEGFTQIRVVAMLLSGGGRHFKRDIPALVATVAAQHTSARIYLDPAAIGTYASIIEAMATQLLDLPSLSPSGELLPGRG